MIGPAPLVTGVKVVGGLVGGIIGGGGRFELVVISAMFDGILAAAGVELMRLGAGIALTGWSLTVHCSGCPSCYVLRALEL